MKLFPSSLSPLILAATLLNNIGSLKPVLNYSILAFKQSAPRPELILKSHRREYHFSLPPGDTRYFLYLRQVIPSDNDGINLRLAIFLFLQNILFNQIFPVLRLKFRIKVQGLPEIAHLLLFYAFRTCQLWRYFEILAVNQLRKCQAQNCFARIIHRDIMYV